MYLCLHEDHSSALVERDNQEIETELVSELHAWQKHSNCPSFWMFICHQSSSVMLESSSPCPRPDNGIFVLDA